MSIYGDKKFKSSLIYPSEEVKEILNKKINEEKQNALDKNNNIENKEFEKELYKNINYQEGKINTLSLFSGAGGLDLGAKLSALSVIFGKEKSYELIKNKDKFNGEDNPINIIYSNDNYKEANETFKNNFQGEYIKDNRNVKDVISFPKSDLILGGFPCPGFSVAGPRLLDDPRNFLYIHYIRALVDSKPYFFVAENVKGLMTMASGKVLEQITEDFSAAGYQVITNLVNAKDYEVPQSRERVFLIGIRNDIFEKYHYSYELPPKSNKGIITLKDTISDLPTNPNDVFDGSYSMIYMSRNRKKSWDEPSFTIQASGRQAPQHPDGEPMTKLEKNKWKFNGSFNRRLSVRECARIQTFPDWFSFVDSVSKKEISKNGKLNQQYKQIGNAVPVYLAEKMIRPITDFILKNLL